MTGLLLFLYYASPCIEFQSQVGNIRPADRDRLLSHLNDNTDPSRTLLRRCFKGAVTGYRQTCKKKEIPADFSYESVAYHWRYNHGHTGDCAVRTGFVSSFFGESMVEVSPEEGGGMFPGKNCHNFHLEIGDRVFVHRGEIADVG